MEFLFAELLLIQNPSTHLNGNNISTIILHIKLCCDVIMWSEERQVVIFLLQIIMISAECFKVDESKTFTSFFGANTSI